MSPWKAFRFPGRINFRKNFFLILERSPLHATLYFDIYIYWVTVNISYTRKYQQKKFVKLYEDSDDNQSVLQAQI